MSDLALPDRRGDVPARVGHLADFVETWLANRRLSDHTRNAYRVDVRLWLAWCLRHELDPLAARFTHVNEYARALEDPAGYGYSPATAARKLSAGSSLYDYLAKLGAVEANPFALADRPLLDKDFSATVSFGQAEAQRIVAAAGDGTDELGPVAPVLARWLLELGTRVSETCALNVGDLYHEAGHRRVTLLTKGGKRISRTLPRHLAALVDAYLESRGIDTRNPTTEQKKLPLLANGRGERVGRHAVGRFVKRIAKRADVPDWDRISPHSFRHAWNTLTREAGAELEDRQEALGHVDPRTTRRYDRTARTAERDPSLLIESFLDQVPAQRPPHDYEPRPGDTIYSDDAES